MEATYLKSESHLRYVNVTFFSVIISQLKFTFSCK